MPRKRKQAGVDESPSQPTAQRLAQEHNITTPELESITEAFALYAARAPDNPERNNHIATPDVKKCLSALGIPPSDRAEQRAIIEAVDPEEEGWVEFERFVAVAALKMQTRESNSGASRRRAKGKRRAVDDDEEGYDEGNGDEEEAGSDDEAMVAYRLFTRGEDREISLADLRRVAKELREEVSDDVLKDMLREATGGEVRGVRMDEFEGVMRRAGVIK